ncbi:uncharacterized protein LOC135215703 [Macrobrachium nipponense]|uniref:uncharacterized protein LOC135215703 n=1 Tax=Macrobrachium nipponense TaxID=159736 RepID=UPI0030C7A7C7
MSKIRLFVSILATVFSVSSVTSGLEVDAQKNFQLRECRQRSWRGDIGSLPANKILPDHPNKVKVLSRSRRFIGWPKGSTLTIYTGLTVPLHTYVNGDTMNLYLGFPFTLNLPSGKLVLKGTTTTTPPPPSSYGHYGNYSSGGSGPYNKQDFPQDSHYNSLSKRSIDSQRRTGFSIIQNGLENLGLPGKSCLMRAVCEVADHPVSDLGLVGDFLNLFLAAGYGEGSEEMADFVSAEDLGRREGDCESKFSDCPLPLADLLQSGLSYLHAGLAGAGSQHASFL